MDAATYVAAKLARPHDTASQLEGSPGMWCSVLALDSIRMRSCRRPHCHRARRARRLSFVAWLVVLALLGASETARAQTDARAKLEYEVPAGSVCPDERGFRDIVAGRLGRDPFVAEADTHVEVLVHTTESGFEGRMRATDRAGAALGERSIASASCVEIATSIALALAIVLDPLGELATESSLSAAAPRARSELAPAPYFELGSSSGLGLVPGVALGGQAGLGARWGYVSVGFEADASTAIEAYADGTALDVLLARAGPVVCGHFEFLLACAGGELGALRARAPELASSRISLTPIAALDVRAGVQIEIAFGLAMRATLALNVPFARTLLYLDDQLVWEAPPIAGQLGLALIATLR